MLAHVRGPVGCPNFAGSRISYLVAPKLNATRLSWRQSSPEQARKGFSKHLCFCWASQHLGEHSLMPRFGWLVRLRLAALFLCCGPVQVEAKADHNVINGRRGRNRMASSRPRSPRFCRARLGGVKCVVAGAGLVLVGRRARTPVTASHTRRERFGWRERERE
jgi:hypothetical protein